MSTKNRVMVYDPSTRHPFTKEYDMDVDDDVCPMSMSNGIPTLCHHRCVFCLGDLVRDHDDGTTLFEMLGDIHDTLASIQIELNGIGR